MVVQGSTKIAKNMLNQSLHLQDFEIESTWSFFATSHDKSPCDGIGGTIKWLTARASLQRTSHDQILTATDILLSFAKKRLKVSQPYLYQARQCNNGEKR